MVSRQQRLSRAAFKDFFAWGIRVHSPYMTIITLPYHEYRYAVVVSKKVARSAVARNRLRRRVYMLLREVTTGFPGVYITILKPAAQTLTKKQLIQEATSIIGRALKNR